MVALHHLPLAHSLHPSLFPSHFRRRRLLFPSASAAASYDESPSSQQTNAISRRHLMALNAAAAAAIALSPLGNKAFAAEDPLSVWERVYLPIDPGVVLLDIAFVPEDPSHGWFLPIIIF